VGLDGIEVLADGSFLVSDVLGHGLFRVNADRKTVDRLAQLAWPADIGLDRGRNLLFVPLFWDSQVVVLRMEGTGATPTRDSPGPGDNSRP